MSRSPKQALTFGFKNLMMSRPPRVSPGDTPLGKLIMNNSPLILRIKADLKNCVLGDNFVVLCGQMTLSFNFQCCLYNGPRHGYQTYQKAMKGKLHERHKLIANRAVYHLL